MTGLQLALTVVAFLCLLGFTGWVGFALGALWALRQMPVPPAPLLEIETDVPAE